MRKNTLRRIISTALTIFMLLSLLPAVTLPASAAVIGGGGAKGDLFSELGFDTSKTPEGYLTKSNPYGSPNRTFNEVHEVLLSWRSETVGEEPGSDGGLFFANGLGKKNYYKMDFTDNIAAAPESALHEYDAQIEVAGDFFSTGQQEQVVGLGLDFDGDLVMYFKDLSGTMNNSDTVKASSASESIVLLSHNEYPYEASDDGGSPIQKNHHNIGNDYEWENYFSLHGERILNACSRGEDCPCNDYNTPNTCPGGEECEATCPNVIPCECLPVYADYSSMLYNYLKLVTGDFTGDGVDEIAVYIPDNANPRVEIYQFRTGMPGANWWNSGAWIKLSTYFFECLTPDAQQAELTYAPNAVSLLAGDFDYDGITDLLLGNAFHTVDKDIPGIDGSYYANHSALTDGIVTPSSYGGRNWKENSFNRDEKTDVLFGEQGSSIFTRRALDITADNAHQTSFFSFGYGDIGYNGAHVSDNPNVLFQANERRIYLYFYDREASKFLVQDCGEIQYDSRAYTYNNEPVPLYMVPSRVVLSNALAVNRGVNYQPGLFWQNMLYTYSNGRFTARSMLPIDRVTNSSGSSGGKVYATAYFGESAVDLDGDGCDEILFYKSQSLRENLSPYLLYQKQLALDVLYNTYMGPREIGIFMGLSSHYSFNPEYINDHDFASDLLPTSCKPVFCTPNIDRDTTILRFKERNFIYSDPEILAVLAAPPMFEDIVNLEAGYGGGSETSFGSMSGSGGSETETGVLSVGAYVALESSVTIPLINVTVAKAQFETSFTSTMSWETETSVSTTYEFGYTTSSMQDSVVLYSVPMDSFTYEIVLAPTAEDVKNNTGRSDAELAVVGEVTIVIPYSPQIRVVDSEEYDRVADDYLNVLPKLRGGIGGDILTHTPGNPGSYPGTAAQFPGSMQSPGPYNGVAYASESGSGSISETIAIEYSTSKSFSHEHVLDVKVGGGTEAVQVGATVGGGGGKGTATVDISGTSFSGTVENMPAAAAQYGYGYSWKLLQYQYVSPLDPSIAFPVVTYTVRDVTSPPATPSNVDIDMAASTGNSLTVSWTYPAGESIRGFEVFKNIRGTEDYIAIPDVFIPYSTAKEDYSYTDTNLAAGSTYSYQVRAVRYGVPQYSAPSKAVTGRTTSIEQGATISLSKYNILVYPDTTNEKITSTLSNPVPGASDTVYIWEKWVNDIWVNTHIYDSDIAVVNPTAEDAGLYRLKVTQRLNDIDIVSYSDILTIEFSKRTSAVNLSVSENQSGQLTVTAIVNNQHSNSLTTPGGYVTIHTTDASGTLTSRTLPLSAIAGSVGIAQASFTLMASQGLYRFEAEYAGGVTFKGSQTANATIYLMGETGYTLELSDTYMYGDPVNVNVMAVTNDSGNIGSQPIQIVDPALLSSGGSNPALAVPDDVQYAVINLFGYTGTSAYNLGDYPPDTGEGTGPSGSEKIRAFISETDSDGTVLDNFMHIMPLDNSNTRYLMVATICKNTSGQPTVIATVSKEYTVTKIPVTVEMPTLYKVVSSEPWSIPENPSDWLNSGNELYPGIGYPAGRSELLPGDTLSDYLSLTLKNHSGQKTPLTNTASPGTYILDVEILPSAATSPYTFTASDGYIYLNSELYTTVVFVQAVDSGAIPGTASVTSPKGTDLGAGKVGYEYNENITITAKPNAGWSVDKWIVETLYRNDPHSYQVEHPANASTPNVLTLKQAYGEVTVTVVFKYNEAVFTFASSDDTRGTVSVVNNPYIVSGSVVGPDTPIVLGAVPKPGYKFTEWVTSVPLTDKSEGVENGMYHLSFKMPESTLTVQALFEPVGHTLTLGPNLTASYEYDHDGILLTPKQTVSIGAGSNSVPYGSVITVVPAVGHRVTGLWSISPRPDDLSIDSDNQRCTFTLLSNVDVLAETQHNNFKFSWTSLAQNVITPVVFVNGTEKLMVGSTEYDLPGGASIVIEAPVYSGKYVFDSFDTGGMSANGYSINGNTLTIDSLASDVSIGLNYRDDNSQYTLVVGLADLGEIEVKINEKTVAVPSTGVTVYRGDRLQFTAVENDSLLVRCGDWVINDTVEKSPSVLAGSAGFELFAPEQDDMITVIHMFIANIPTNKAVSWGFEGIDPEEPGFTISAIKGSGGQIVNPASLTMGTRITLSATLPDNLVVDYWTINGEEVLNNSDKLTCIITGETEIKAVVSDAAPQKVSVIIDQPENGLITPLFSRSHTGSGTSEDPYLTAEGTELILTVVPDNGYQISDLMINGPDGNPINYADVSKDGVFIASISNLEQDITVSATIEQVDNSIMQLKQIIMNRNWSVAMTAANTLVGVKSWISGQIAALGVNGVSVNIDVTDFTSAVAGTKTEPQGTEGSFSFTATLSKGLSQDTVTVTNGIITPTAYTPSPPEPVTPGGGGGGGGDTPPATQTLPVQNGTINVPFTVTSGTAALKLTDDTVSKIIAEIGTDEEVLFDLSTITGTTAATLPKAAVTAMAGAGLGLVVKLPEGALSLDEEAAASISGRATGDSLTIELKQIATDKLSQKQQTALQQGDIVFDINISSGNFKITSFNGSLTVEIPYDGPRPVTMWYLNEQGELQAITCTDTNGVIAFSLNHLSLYLLRQEAPETSWLGYFTDVRSGDWFYDDVEYAVTKGLFNGTSATTFSPQMPMTRGMLVTVLGRLTGVDESKYTISDFADVTASQYYAPYIQWAKELGIVTGVGGNDFLPDRAISRQDLVVILYRYSQVTDVALPSKNALISFSDEMDIADYAKDAVSVIRQAGIISGKPGNLFDANGSATRAEVAAILHRFMENGVNQ